jgi:hypothetical protein
MIGTAAFVSARKQKIQSASLFEQRKLGLEAAANKRRRRDSSEAATTAAGIEMTQMEEMVPLTQDAVDVV